MPNPVIEEAPLSIPGIVNLAKQYFVVSNILLINTTQIIFVTFLFAHFPSISMILDELGMCYYKILKDISDTTTLNLPSIFRFQIWMVQTEESYITVKYCIFSD